MSETFSIPQNPTLKPYEDFFELRRKGIGYIEQMGSRWWTDYNLHDPGITILEALCYAITDLSYRTGWEMKDLLMQKDGKTAENQSFFTAKEILTISPLTPNDYRKLLIDLEGIRNAWVMCKQCACEIPIYVRCENKELKWGYKLPVPSPKISLKGQIQPRGLYEVLVQLEPMYASLKEADFNGAVNMPSTPVKIEANFTHYYEEGRVHSIVVEALFQAWELTEEQIKQVQDFIMSESFDAVSITINDAKNRQITTGDAFKQNWRNLYKVAFNIKAEDGTEINFMEVPVRVIGSDTAKDNFDLDEFKDFLEAASDQGLVIAYRNRLRNIAGNIAAVKKQLHQHRNLDEDFCRIQLVPIEEIAVCADIEVDPDADIEKIQAEVWWQIEQYLNPTVPFYSLQELQNEKTPVEDIFNGPMLDHGFIKTEDLLKSALKKDIRTSDLINLLADIAGVKSVNNLLITKYNAAGEPIKGAADGGLNKDRISANWTMAVSAGHQPELNRNISRFLFYKNGLPFLPRTDEAYDTLVQLRGAVERPKLKDVEADLPIPVGTYRNAADYYPVQYTLPMTYGVGEEGLPSHVSDRRREQAGQLKGYLMIFEQLLLNAHAQIVHIDDLFSTDSTVKQTYFSQLIDNETISGSEALLSGLGLDKAKLQDLIENPTEFLRRRNHFLDHLLARFGENMSEYTLMMSTLNGEKLNRQDIINNKISFLNKHAALGHDRAKAFNYQNNTGVSGLQNRIKRLLGFSEEQEFFVVEHLLLRPKFSGDALFEICSDSGCDECEPQDPYSFRLTFVMPGWIEPFNTNLEMRRFAERVIRQETPSHLLPKICWVGNDGAEKETSPEITYLISRISEQIFSPLSENNLTEEEIKKAKEEACDCAAMIYKAFQTAFLEWFKDKTTQHFSQNGWREKITELFKDRSTAEFACLGSIPTDNWEKIKSVLTVYFTGTAVYGLQFDRFKVAWEGWRKANAELKTDSTALQLHQHIEVILKKHLNKNQKPVPDVCVCAKRTLEDYGQQFYDWMKIRFEAGEALETIDVSTIPQAVSVACADIVFDTDPTNDLNVFLTGHYRDFITASYRLWELVKLMEKLENTYPAATLHDCDDGNDDNPVRLGSTALGSN